MFVAGVVLLAANPGGFGVEGFSMSIGGGLSLLVLKWTFRLGVVGDSERAREEESRRYLVQHAHWPDEEPRRERRR